MSSMSSAQIISAVAVKNIAFSHPHPPPHLPYPGVRISWLSNVKDTLISAIAVVFLYIRFRLVFTTFMTNQMVKILRIFEQSYFSIIRF